MCFYLLLFALWLPPILVSFQILDHLTLMILNLYTACTCEFLCHFSLASPLTAMFPAGPSTPPRSSQQQAQSDTTIHVHRPEDAHQPYPYVYQKIGKAYQSPHCK